METQTVVLGKESYEVADPVMFLGLVNQGKTPQEAFAIVDEIIKAFNKIMDGGCTFLTVWPPHKIEYTHICDDGGRMRLLLEKLPPLSP